MEERVSPQRALELIAVTAAPLEAEPLPADAALGRVLARDVIAPMDQPPFPRSPLDGYAFRAQDVQSANRRSPSVLRVVDTVYAGDWCDRRIAAGEAVRLMTGALIPRDCNCVVRQEDTDPGEETVRVYTPLSPFENYCRQGEDYRAGEVLLPAGSRLGGLELGVLSSAGLCTPDHMLSVRRVPRVALLCTGDELVDSAVTPLPRGKIYASSRDMLRGRLLELGMLPVAAQSCPDDPVTIAAALRALSARADVILTTGGVSVGAKDMLHHALPLLGAEQIFWRVAVKPGTPLMYARYGDTSILCLSGNPFAAAATFELFARPLLAGRAGNPALLPQRAQATLANGFLKGGGVRRLLRGCYRDGVVRLPEGHSSGSLRSAAGANCLVELEEGRGPVEAGETVAVYLI